MSTPREDTEILVVGAGLAGLRLASRLYAAGRDVVLLEARHRVGGRILSPDIKGQAYDLGPSWFWPGQPRMAALAASLGIAVFEQFAEGTLAYEDATGAVRRDLTMAPMAGSLRLAGGVGELTDQLAAALPEGCLHCGTLVSDLAYADGRIRASGTDDSGPWQINADRVALALPPRLVEATIRFAPALTADAKSAMQSVPTWMAGQAKLVAIYERPFWRDAGLSGDAMSQRGPLAEIHDASPADGRTGALFGFVGVPAAARRGKADLVKTAAVEQLVALFGSDAAMPVDVILQDWAEEPLTAVAADDVLPNGHPRYGMPAALRGLWGGRLIFASSEIGTEFGGFLEGALEAADAAADLLIDP
ncbi:MAG: FAD-dependent oxidoreductase [Pseudomonadota bacterium]